MRTTGTTSSRPGTALSQVRDVSTRPRRLEILGLESFAVLVGRDVSWQGGKPAVVSRDSRLNLVSVLGGGLGELRSGTARLHLPSLWTDLRATSI